MKLLVFVCVCALAVAEQQHGGVPTPSQLAIGLGHLYRRFLHVTAPKQLELQDALDIKWSDGFLAGPAFYSPAKAVHGGVEQTAFSFINFLINPGDAGHDSTGKWVKNDVSDVVFFYHYGAPVKIHMLSEAGHHTEAVMGNPLDHPGAKFFVLVPKSTYSVFKSLSENEATFHSYIDIPAWSESNHQEIPSNEMAAKFPKYTRLFNDLAKPGHHEDHHDDHRGDHHDDQHDHHHDDQHGNHRDRHSHHLAHH